MPSGLQSSISSGTLTISGTPIFTNNDYSFSVFTTDGNTNCSQVSQTITLSKNQSSPSFTLDSGSYNQTIDLGNSMTPIVVTYGGATSSLTITGLPYTQSGNIVTIDKTFTVAGTYSGTITTISSGGCNEITQSIVVTVNAPVVTNTGGATSGGTTTGGTTTGGGGDGVSSGDNTSNTTSSTNSSNDSTSCTDNNTYTSIVIGSQEWFNVPLQTTCFQNGDNINLIEDNNTWSSTTQPGYVIKNGYYIYNYYAATDSRKICPNGYRVPNSNDWRTLFEYVKGSNSLYQLGIDLLPGGVTGFNASENTYRGKGGEYYENQPLSYYQTTSSNQFAIIGNINVDNPYTQVNNINTNLNNAGYCIRCIKN
ncbi:MAG: FISUMP domain-containing protein [Flavobacteriaceae bacterium]|nr:FISUMP domain-containing protein [Flavobacteriaceae bacterium]